MWLDHHLTELNYCSKSMRTFFGLQVKWDGCVCHPYPRRQSHIRLTESMQSIFNLLLKFSQERSLSNTFINGIVSVSVRRTVSQPEHRQPSHRCEANYTDASHVCIRSSMNRSAITHRLWSYCIRKGTSAISRKPCYGTHEQSFTNECSLSSDLWVVINSCIVGYEETTCSSQWHRDWQKQKDNRDR